MQQVSSLFCSLIDDRFDQGDPNIMEVPASERAKYKYRYYAFVTGDGELERSLGFAEVFPCYGSNDLFQWEHLGMALTAGDSCTRWAPCVGFYPDLERPFVMLYSRARGCGEDAHVQHKIRRADAISPEGPYIDSGEVLTADLDFSIDPNVYRDPSGKLRMAFATDFVDDEPLGTGLAEIGLAEDARTTYGCMRKLARAQADWQIYERTRTMPWKTVPGIDWQRGDRVKWHCMEGPVGGIVGPTGRRFIFYSSGNYSHLYAVGILEELKDGTIVDLSIDPNNCLLAPDPEKSFFSVGRIGIVTGPDGTEYASFHARFGSPSASRRLGLAKLTWTADGAPTVSA